MAVASHISERMRRIRHEVNRNIMKKCSTLLSKSRLGTVLQTEEGMEVDGFAEYTLASPVRHVDFTRLAVPWRLFTLALLNQQVVVKRFIVVPEHKFYIVLDLSRSMRYPLIKVYGGEEISDRQVPLLYSAKINVMKLVAGAVLKAAIDSGYTVHIVTFGKHGLIKEKAQRHRAQIMALFNLIDEQMDAITVRPQQEESMYEETAKNLMALKGKFLFVGDFMDPVYEWDDDDVKRRWMRTLGFFRQWALNRPVALVRVNHYAEVRPLGDDLKQRGRMVHPLGDRCDVDTERSGHSNESIVYEHYMRCVHRLRLQSRWEQELTRTLRSVCAGYLSVNSRNYERNLRRELEYVWSRVTGGEQ